MLRRKRGSWFLVAEFSAASKLPAILFGVVGVWLRGWRWRWGAVGGEGDEDGGGRGYSEWRLWLEDYGVIPARRMVIRGLFFFGGR